MPGPSGNGRWRTGRQEKYLGGGSLSGGPWEGLWAPQESREALGAERAASGEKGQERTASVRMKADEGGHISHLFIWALAKVPKGLE